MNENTAIDKMPELGGGSGTIGGSNVAAVLGLYPPTWAGPYDVWEAATIGKKRITSPAIERGTRLEPVVRDLAEEALGLTCVEPLIRTIYHADDPRFTASVDIEVWSPDGTIAGLGELKTANSRANWRQGVPNYYWPQLQHYLWIRNIHRGWYVCLQADDKVFPFIETAADGKKAIELGLADLWVYEVRREESYTRDVVPLLEEFHDRYIATGTPPPPDWTDGCRRVLRRLYPKREGYTKITDELLEAARSKAWWSTQEKVAKEKKLEADNRIRSMLAGKLAAVDELAFHRIQQATTAKEKRAAMASIQQRVEVSSRKGKRSLNQAALREAHPEIYEQFLKTGEAGDAIKIKGVE